MTTLKKGSKGPEVEHLQQQLKDKGFYTGTVDGDFGGGTYNAVVAFQKSVYLSADGVAGNDTQTALAYVRGPLIDVINQVISDKGLGFIYGHEAQSGVSNHLYWPKGSSGVTLGAGYDMKERTASDIQKTLMSIGLSQDVAAKASKGAGLTGTAADNFAKANHNLIDLTEQQEDDLLRVVVPPYVKNVTNLLKVPLAQNEFDVLVDFAYNPGGQLDECIVCINKSDINGAMKVIQSVIHSGGQVMPGLVTRRNDECACFLAGIY